LVSPLTSESSALISFLTSIDSKSISEGGTDFKEVLQLTTDRFDTKEHNPHAIVLLSDGGDPDDTLD
jgi:Ca-activated chloride channel family protein